MNLLNELGRTVKNYDREQAVNSFKAQAEEMVLAETVYR